jgi:hypothetical protein
LGSASRPRLAALSIRAETGEVVRTADDRGAIPYVG